MAKPLTVAYQRQLATLRTLTSRQVGSAWTNLGGYDKGNVDGFVARVVPKVRSGQTQAVRLTNAYMARFTRGRPADLDLEALVGAGVRNGATPAEVYARPFVNVWTALGKGVPYANAVAAGLARVTSTAAMDVALSSRAAGVAYAATDDRITGFQRVPDGGACDFCQLVAGQRYHSEDLMPLHNRCGCTVEPLMGVSVGRAKDVVKGDGATAAVREHGELGPMLTNGTDAFTGPDDI